MKMLNQLPTEIIHQIASHLPTASSVINFSLTNRRLHAQLSTDDYATFRAFVQRNFPSIKTPPYWKEAACILTTRARAWDRRAFVGKALEPPADRLNPLYYERARGPSIGYAPVIDSYETWYGCRWADRHEVLAWGAAGRLLMRISNAHSTSWLTHRVRDDQMPDKDILDLHLLRPNQKSAGMEEEVIIRRANKRVTKLQLQAESHELHEKTLFDTGDPLAECIDVSNGSKPLLAVCNPDSIQVFDGSTGEQLSQPISALSGRHNSMYKHRKRCAAFLDGERLAVGIQYLEGQNTAPINIYRIAPDGSSTSWEHCLPSHNEHTSGKGQNRNNANVIVALDNVSSLSSRPGDVFLSGWSDGIVRLYDLRAPTHSSIDFHDGVDENQVLSLLPIGHERFLAGSVQNACLKTFDLRMPGSRVYSYSKLESPKPPVSAPSHEKNARGAPHVQNRGPVDQAISRELNISLAIRVQCPMRLWQPLPKQELTHLPRYRGAVYSLSAPSPASPTVYAGVENHVIQLDFVSTDDVQRGRQGLSAFGLNFGKGREEQILNLSCYERPRAGHESTDALLLRTQAKWNRSRAEDGVTEDGWDERWRLPNREEHRSNSWRRSSRVS
jgi:hypothetical protein